MQVYMYRKKPSISVLAMSRDARTSMAVFVIAVKEVAVTSRDQLLVWSPSLVRVCMKGPEIEKGLGYLMQFKPGMKQRNFRRQVHYYYGHYYAVQAMWHAGGEYWNHWYPAIRDELLTNRRRTKEGAWPSNICNEYGTAMACIVLQMPNNYLPIFQR